MALDQSVIAELKAKIADRELAELNLPEGDFVISSAPAAEYARFRSSEGATERFQNLQVLVGVATLYPAREKLDSLLTRYPGLVDTLGGEIVDLSGARSKVTRRKL